jgi:N12 class adenine-specific DNA methylase
VFATGTPISNTPAEMYTMLRYLAPQMLSERKVEHFDSWAANFAEARDITGTRPGRLGPSDAHPVCQIHQSARIAYHIPQLLLTCKLPVC